jgi:capsular exopolysaccharide synthesis family protein
MAQSGKRILLIDADLREPRLQAIFRVAVDVGLASVLTDSAEAADAIQRTEVAGLDLLPAGPVPSDPAEVLASPRFGELFESLRDPYDFVLVDTAPLLQVTDPCIVAPNVDGVLLAIRNSRSGRPEADRAREILDTLHVNVLGVVVSGIDGSDRLVRCGR